MADFGSIVRWLVPLLMAFSAGVGAYIGVLKAIATLRLEMHRELAQRDVVIAEHEQRIRTSEDRIRSLECV